MRKYFFISLPVLYTTVYLMGLFHPIFFGWYVILVPLTIIGLKDVMQKKHIILRNYPVIGHFRYLLEEIRPEIQQYFIEQYEDGKPFSREQRSTVYQRAKGEVDSAPFGTQLDLYKIGAEWLEHSIMVAPEIKHEPRVKIGGDKCTKPYEASHLNISAMSYGSLSPNAVESLNKGAAQGGFYHNTGEGGLSPYHLKYNADVVWQIGTGYFGCRNQDGSFNLDLFAERAVHPNVKMIELKISQGAKPGHGGILPAKKVTPEIAQIRLVPLNKDVISPPSHSAFKNPIEMLQLIDKMREKSGGKPVGFKMCVGKKQDFFAICKAMLELNIFPDFITIDGAEGGTGAAPKEFSNFIGTPLNEGLSFVHNTLSGLGIREKIKIICSGKVIDAFSLITKISLGADLCNSARGMMFAVGCIQALRCNTNNCPAGVATQNPELYELLDIESKSERVTRFHKETIHQVLHLLSAGGFTSFSEINKKYVVKRVSQWETKTYADLYPDWGYRSLLENKAPQEIQKMWQEASASKFA
jgi:glutamate synthase domain-containing protein 2